MDANKYEAERCIELAKRFIVEKDREKAEKFLRKAESLFPSENAKSLLQYIQLKFLHQNQKQKSPNRKVNSNNEKSSSSQTTKKQQELAKHINNCKNYYEILGVDKNATDTEIRRTYKQLALHLHPDKNDSPSALEAFKTLVNTVTVLTDPEKRKQYNKFLSDEEEILHNRNHYRTYSASHPRFFESDASTEDFFNRFFNNTEDSNIFEKRNKCTCKQNIYTGTMSENHREQVPQQDSGITIFLQLLPILIAIFLSMTSSIFISDPVYSLQQTAKYTVHRKTEYLHLSYYVKNTFSTEHQASVKRLEEAIEEEYITNLRNYCHKEKNYRESMMWKARNFGDANMFQQAQNIPTPSCDTLRKIDELRNILF